MRGSVLVIRVRYSNIYIPYPFLGWSEKKTSRKLKKKKNLTRAATPGRRPATSWVTSSRPGDSPPVPASALRPLNTRFTAHTTVEIRVIYLVVCDIQLGRKM